METILLGAVASLLVQWIKNVSSTSKIGTLGIVAVLSFVLAFGAFMLQRFNLWSTFLTVLATATTIYAFIIQHLEE